ncbi:hypothetical protein VTK73DRAFT_10126 [Phialemonium thermophilum]|uniref:non-specific serine/threonine protein kinase n=1 Tax=Phialemonium thermophilum TaxID=223376 RepID=A0ABR3VYE0_9PEZI
MQCARSFSELRAFWSRALRRSPLPAPRRFFVARPRQTALEIDHPIEEEIMSGKRLQYYYPARPGEVLDDRFRTVTKLGYGSSSTVWLAENLERKKSPVLPRYVSIKITAADETDGEAQTLRVISGASTSLDASCLFNLPIDEFQLQGPEGTHHCLVFQPLRETILETRSRLPGQRLPPLFAKYLTWTMLLALDYLHTRCGIIHTGLTEANIMMTIESDALLSQFAQFHRRNPPPRHVRPDGRATYVSQSDFGPLRIRGAESTCRPKLVDLAEARRKDAPDAGFLDPIQAHAYRAPEVLLGCGWTEKVDIWNLGVLMWQWLEGIDLFPRILDEQGRYDAHVHLAEMVSVLGAPPEELVSLERHYRDGPVVGPATNERGKTYLTMNEYWGGPFFDDDGQILRKDLITPRNLADTIKVLSGDEKEEFLDFASGMLEWYHPKRKTASELLRHPIFDDIYRSEAGTEEEGEGGASGKRQRPGGRIHV